MIAKGWVKTPEQIRKIQERLAAPAFLQGKMMSVSFLTRPEIVRGPAASARAGQPAARTVSVWYLRDVELRRRICRRHS